MASRPCYPSQDGCSGDEIHEYVLLLHQKGVRTIIVLLEENEMKRYYDEIDLISFYKMNGFQSIHYPIEDFAVPSNIKTFINLLESIDNYLDNGIVLIHCSAGMGRSGLVAASYLVYKGYQCPNAINMIRNANPYSIESTLQENFIRELYYVISANNQEKRMT